MYELYDMVLLKNNPSAVRKMAHVHLREGGRIADPP